MPEQYFSSYRWHAIPFPYVGEKHYIKLQPEGKAPIFWTMDNLGGLILTRKHGIRTAKLISNITGKQANILLQNAGFIIYIYIYIYIHIFIYICYLH